MANILRQLKYKINVARLQGLDQTWQTSTLPSGVHSTSYSRLYMPISGEGYIAFNDFSTKLIPGYLYLIPPYVGLQAGTETYLKKYWTHFNANLFNTALDVFSASKTSYRHKIESPEVMEHLFRKLVQHYYQPTHSRFFKIDPYDAAISESALNLLLEPFVRDIKPLKTKQEFSLLRLADIIHYMEENLDKPVLLETLAKRVKLTPTYLSNLFKSQLGVSPIQYCNSQRIIKAKELLTTTDLQISEIADKVGAESSDSFYKLFSRHVKMSPRQYRMAISTEEFTQLNGLNQQTN